MSKRLPPYFHADGSNCWTVNCSRNHDGKTVDKGDINSAFGEGKTMLSSLFPEGVLQKHVNDGLVVRAEHPNQQKLSIYKYSREAQYGRIWDEITTACRGLIVNTGTGEVVARPFPKFFNYGELSEEELREKAVGPMHVMEKLDGSFIIGYTDMDGAYKLATAGGFDNEQRLMAQEIYDSRYAGKWNSRPNTTYMWELIHPENRIVVDYEGEEDIHLIGAVSIRSGRSIPLDELTEWRWKRAVTHKFESLEDVLSSEDRPNTEGYIIHFPETDFRVKVKHEDYLRLHRDATGLSERKVWKYLKSGEFELGRQRVIEEFHDFYDATGKHISEQVTAAKQEYYDEYDRLAEGFSGSTKKEWVDHVRVSAAKDKISTMMSWYGKDDSDRVLSANVETKIWDAVKPEEVRSLWQLQGQASKAKREASRDSIRLILDE